MRVVIEGAKLTVCAECSKHGKPAYEEPANSVFQPQRTTGKSVTQGTPFAGPIQIKKRVITARVDTSNEIVADYAEVIRQAREKMGLSHEELGKKISERESLLKKIEMGKMEPNELLASKLEHTLKIKLVVPVVVDEKIQVPKTASHEFTLGDAVKISKKAKGE
jgi:putative transcription factor